MKTINLFLLLLFTSLIFPQKQGHPINPTPSFAKKSFITSTDTIKILAIMVDFAEDKDAATYGTGKFNSHYSKNYGNEIIDPTPHDKKYFEYQLKGTENYFTKNSNGKIKIVFKVFDNVINLPRVMSYYSPAAKSTDFSNLGKLFTETWRTADSLYPTFDFSSYDLFIIFHAGVGRDINLSDNFNLEKDIPSVYLNLQTLKKYLGNNFNGLSVNNGKKLITNSVILPETDSRETSSFTGTFLIELGIQGLLASSIASYLGLPDLYNTETGLSAIGRFGLMDGQAIFSYGGVLPPEPSAWEKYFLGWAEPIEVKSDMQGIEIITRYMNQGNNPHIIKVPINASEYYLIENRQRDALNNGAKISYYENDVLKEMTFTKDTTGFYFFNIDSLKGIVVGADEYDWSLPGSGIAIWHIDEKVIAEKFNENKINVNENRRGVRLIEADGIQDIGVLFTTIFGDKVVGDGEPDDLWFKDNKAKLYKNEFTESSLPSTVANDEAPSYIRMTNFSANGGKMKFDLSFGNNEIKPVLRERVISKAKEQYIIPYSGNTDKYFYSVNKRIYIFDKVLNKSTLLAENSDYPAVYFTHQSVEYIAFTSGDTLVTVNLSSLQPEKKYFKVNNVKFSTSPQYYAGNIYSGDITGGITEFSIQNNTYNTIKADDNAIKFFSYVNPEFKVILSSKNIVINNNKFSLGQNNPSRLVIATEDTASNSFAYVIYDNNQVETFNKAGRISAFSIPGLNNNGAAAGDIKKDGNIYLIITYKDLIYAYNKAGYLASGFPIKQKNRNNFYSNPYLADFNNDENPEIIIESEDGQLSIFDAISGKELTQYNLSLGVPNSGSALLVNSNNKLYYNTISDSGNFNIYQLSSTAKTIYWSSRYGDANNSGVSIVKKSKSSQNEYFPKSMVYNWPNPVYENSTNIRYFVKEDSKINIKIFDLGGVLVGELNGFGTGGMESEIKWDITNIESGVYFARVEANSQNNSGYAIIKIAVVK